MDVMRQLKRLNMRYIN